MGAFMEKEDRWEGGQFMTFETCPGGKGPGCKEVGKKHLKLGSSPPAGKRDRITRQDAGQMVVCGCDNGRPGSEENPELSIKRQTSRREAVGRAVHAPTVLAPRREGVISLDSVQSRTSVR